MGKSSSLMRIYKLFCVQRRRNLEESYKIADRQGINSTSNYASYGLEFPHAYYGARQYWTSEGWEVNSMNEVGLSHLCPEPYG